MYSLSARPNEARQPVSHSWIVGSVERKSRDETMEVLDCLRPIRWSFPNTNGYASAYFGQPYSSY